MEDFISMMNGWWQAVATDLFLAVPLALAIGVLIVSVGWHPTEVRIRRRRRRIKKWF